MVVLSGLPILIIANSIGKKKHLFIICFMITSEIWKPVLFIDFNYFYCELSLLILIPFSISLLAYKCYLNLEKLISQLS